MKMKNNRIIFILLLLVLIVSSCASEMKTVEQITPTLINSSKTPTTIPTIENTLSPTSESDTLIQVEKSCMNLENLPADLELTGVWVRQPSYPFLENLIEETKYSVPLDGGGFLNHYQGYWSVSPNGEWLAYLDTIIDKSRTEGYSLKVIHSSGHSLSMNYWPISIFHRIRRWIDNQNLLVTLDNRDIVLNPFSGKWYELKKPKWLEEALSEVPWFDPYQYGPHLNQVIVHLNNHSELRDFDTGNNTFGNSSIGGFSENAWSLDGVMLAINNGSVFYLFKDKKEILELDLVQLGILEASYDGSYYFDTLEWSLDHQKILIEVSDNTVVLDIKERKIYDICFVDKNFGKQWVYTSGFFSSAEGQYIIVSRSFVGEDSSIQYIDILIDLKNMRAYKLETPRNSERIGWLKLP